MYICIFPLNNPQCACARGYSSLSVCLSLQPGLSQLLHFLFQSSEETTKRLEEELQRLKKACDALTKEVTHLRSMIHQASTVIRSSLEVALLTAQYLVCSVCPLVTACTITLFHVTDLSFNT